MRVAFEIGPSAESREAARRRAGEQKESRARERGAEQAALDGAVAAELERLAGDGAWDRPAGPPPDPYAPHLKARVLSEDGRRYFAVGVEVRRPTEDELSVEFRKRLGS